MEKKVNNLDVFFENLVDTPYKLITLRDVTSNNGFRNDGDAELLFFENGEILGRYYQFIYPTYYPLDYDKPISEIDDDRFIEKSLILGKVDSSSSIEALKYYEIYPGKGKLDYAITTMHVKPKDQVFLSKRYFDTSNIKKVQACLKRINGLVDNSDLYKQVSEDLLYRENWNFEEFFDDIGNKTEELTKKLVKEK